MPILLVGRKLFSISYIFVHIQTQRKPRLGSESCFPIPSEMPCNLVFVMKSRKKLALEKNPASCGHVLPHLV